MRALSLIACLVLVFGCSARSANLVTPDDFRIEYQMIDLGEIEASSSVWNGKTQSSASADLDGYSVGVSLSWVIDQPVPQSYIDDKRMERIEALLKEISCEEECQEAKKTAASHD